ncbi:MAG: methyltransferase regulatory domain-containing protein [Tepidisphaerales bacterium]
MSTAAYYDQVPYTSNPYLETSPGILEGLAWLQGYNPPPIETARVLELGCAAGGNLSPFAYAFPGSRCRGIDFSPKQIEAARRVAEAAELRNVDYVCKSILDVTAEDGTFDYIICHGVYSWVPPDVQEKILRICQELLSPAGMAFISYNVYPGWHLKRWLRDALMFKAQGIEDPKERVRRGMELLQYITEVPPHSQMPIAALIKTEFQSVGSKETQYVLHEYLEPINEPCHFQEFAKKLAAHQLRYVSDARTNGISIGNPQHPAAQAMLAPGIDPIVREQNIDFVINRSFRRSIITRQSHAPEPNAPAQRLPNMHLVSFCRPAVQQAAGVIAQEVRFDHPTVGSVVVRERGLMGIMQHMSDVAPQAVPVNDMLERTRLLVGQTAEQFAPRRNTLIGELLTYVLSGLLHCYRTPSKFFTSVSNKPRASRLARVLSQGSTRLTNLRHEPIDMDENWSRFLRLLDGTRTIDDLVREVPGSNPEHIKQFLAQVARRALLEA